MSRHQSDGCLSMRPDLCDTICVSTETASYVYNPEVPCYKLVEGGANA